MKNNKGFTLIELLAVIVILAVLLAIAIPAVSKYINDAKKSTFIQNAQSYAKAAKSEMLVGKYITPVNKNEAVVISFKNLETALENGGIKSSYDGTFDATKSFVMIVNKDDAEDPTYVYYIAAADSKGYGIGEGTGSSTAAKAIAYDSITKANVVQLGLNNDAKKTPKGITSSAAAQALGVTIIKSYLPSGS